MENIHPIFDRLLSRDEREARLRQRSAVFWLTGLSGSGKSTLAAGLERALFEKGYTPVVLDGDNIRSGINNNLGFSLEDRRENIRRIAEVARLFVRSGIVVITSFISPTREIRAFAESIIGSDDYAEVFVNTPLAICEQRDVKGLYARARKGEIRGFTGIDSPYEPPVEPALEIRTEELEIEEGVALLTAFAEGRIQYKGSSE